MNNNCRNLYDIKCCFIGSFCILVFYGLGEVINLFKFNNGRQLVVFNPGKGFPQAKLMWIKKDLNNTTRLG